MQFGRLADRADRPERMIGVRGDLLLGRVVGRRDVDRDAVVGPMHLSRQEGLVVRSVVPRRDALDHVLVELFGVFERLGGLGRVDDDLVVLVDQVAAVRPQAPVHPGIAVARGVAERKAARRIVALGRLGVFEEGVGGVGKFGEARLLQRRDAIVRQVAAVADRDRDPLVAALAVLDRARYPAVVLLAEVFGDVADIEALLRKEVGQRIEPPEQVRAGAGIGGDRRLRLHVLVGFAGDIDLHAGGLGEGVDQLHERVVLALHEVFPAQHRELRAGFRLPGRGLRPGAGPAEQAFARERAGRRQRSAALHEGAAGGRRHGRFLRCCLLYTSRCV